MSARQVKPDHEPPDYELGCWLGIPALLVVAMNSSIRSTTLGGAST
jgi:hypothetical protein